MLYQTFVVGTTTTGHLADCRRQQQFFEMTDYNRLSSNDALARGETLWVLANPGESYIAYANNASNQLGLNISTARACRHKIFIHKTTHRI